MWPPLLPFWVVLGFVLLSETATAADEARYYTRREEALGIEVKAPKSVRPEALKAARLVVTSMLAARSDIADRMKEQKAAVAIIPRDRVITSLPEFAPLSGKKDANGSPYDSFKVRGGGAVAGQPVTATSEENLLQLKDDPFAAESIACHEFAHAIMNLGFTDDERRQWKEIYERARQNNLFPGAFAMKSADEYWAELSQSYFGVNNEINGPLIIQEADPEAYRFLDAVYAGAAAKKGKPARRGRK